MLLRATCSLLLTLAFPALAMASGIDKYEVWAVDQSNSKGTTYGGTIYIYDGHALERGHAGASAVPEKIDLSGAAAALCMAQTGANPVRPHMIAINPSQTHAIVSFVASGHVLFMNAATRAPIACIRTSIGAGGARQVHFAISSPDERYLSVANQNGKLFERINTDYSTNTFTLDSSARIDLANCTTPNGVPCQAADVRPDNAPICPVIDATSRYTFLTLRGGGLFVVDSTKTPMQIVAEYDKDTVHPNGCLGAGGRQDVPRLRRRNGHEPVRSRPVRVSREWVGRWQPAEHSRARRDIQRRCGARRRARRSADRAPALPLGGGPRQELPLGRRHGD